jgi:hypothetical protein
LDFIFVVGLAIFEMGVEPKRRWVWTKPINNTSTEGDRKDHIEAF